MSTRHEKNGLLKEAIRLALYASLATAAVSPAAMAQQNDDEVEEVVTTGSRITRTTIEESGNLVSMDREDIDATGNLMIADVLRSSPLNTYGSFSERSGSSAQSNATINLRGLGSDRTLVLINGHRIPGSPNLGAASVNINMIPMAAVERIEMLPDAASAIYGSDAIAGVVNIILKKGYEGLTFSIRKGDRSNDDGGEQSISLLGGLKGEQGNITFAIESNKRDPIFDRDRDFTKAYANDSDGDGVLENTDLVGYSFYGKNIILQDKLTGYFDLQAGTDCPTGNGFIGQIPYANGLPFTTCPYNYADISANKAELNRFNSYIDFNFEISESVEFFTNLVYSTVDSFGRYAPPAAQWSKIPEDYAGLPYDIPALIADGTISPVRDDPETEAIEGYQLTGYYRWYLLGNRDNYVTDNQYDVTTGLRGTLKDDMNFEVYAQYDKYTSNELGYNYLLYPGLEAVIAAGDEPFSTEGANRMRVTTSQDNSTSMKKLYGHIEWSAGDLFGAGESSLVAGAETFTIKYKNKYDSLSEAGEVGGSAGNSSSGDRDVSALFVEAVIPLPEDVEVDLALRGDDYSDFGSEISPSIGAVWSANEDVKIRARWSKGFKAPALSDLYGPETFSASFGIDYKACTDAGNSPSDCPDNDLYDKQFDNYISSNPNLDAEESTNFSLGVNWQISDSWTVDLAYWKVDIDNLIVSRSIQSLFYAEVAGIDLSDPNNGNYIDRSVPTQPVIYTTSDNEGELKASGIDIKLNGDIETDYGTFSPFLLASKSLSYKQQAFYKGPIQDTAGFSYQPEIRMNLGTVWTMGPHSIDLLVEHIGDYARNDEVIVDGPNTRLVASSDKVDTWTGVNLSYSYDAEEYGKIKIGSNNITNEDPVLNTKGRFDREAYDLYDATGRVVYVEYTIEF